MLVSPMIVPVRIMDKYLTFILHVINNKNHFLISVFLLYLSKGYLNIVYVYQSE